MEFRRYCGRFFGDLLPDQVRKPLIAATKSAPDLVPYLAIALFAGVRPTELSRLRWEEINFDLKYIHITGKVAKVCNERYVDIEDVLMLFLAYDCGTIAITVLLVLVPALTRDVQRLPEV